MRIKCNKCHKFININIFQYFPEELYCMYCGNTMIFNKYFSFFLKVLYYLILFFLLVWFHYITKYFRNKLPIDNNLINKLCALGISLIIFVCVYTIISVLIYKICLAVYMYVYNKKEMF